MSIGRDIAGSFAVILWLTPIGAIVFWCIHQATYLSLVFNTFTVLLLVLTSRYISTIVHALGHVLAANKFGAVHSVLLWPIRFHAEGNGLIARGDFPSLFRNGEIHYVAHPDASSSDFAKFFAGGIAANLLVGFLLAAIALSIPQPPLIPFDPNAPAAGLEVEAIVRGEPVQVRMPLFDAQHRHWLAQQGPAPKIATCLYLLAATNILKGVFGTWPSGLSEGPVAPSDAAMTTSFLRGEKYAAQYVDRIEIVRFVDAGARPRDCDLECLADTLAAAPLQGPDPLPWMYAYFCYLDRGIIDEAGLRLNDAWEIAHSATSEHYWDVITEMAFYEAMYRGGTHRARSILSEIPVNRRRYAAYFRAEAAICISAKLWHNANDAIARAIDVAPRTRSIGLHRAENDWLLAMQTEIKQRLLEADGMSEAIEATPRHAIDVKPGSL